MALPFEFIVPGHPLSQGSRHSGRWVSKVQDVAKQHWSGGETPTAEAVTLTVILIHDNLRIDVDNASKPILDALKGLIFMDDAQVTDLICRKRNLNHDLTVRSDSRILIDALTDGGPFVYLRIEESLDREAVV